MEIGDTETLFSGFDETQARHDGPAGMELDHFGAMLNLQWDLDSFTITSITGVDQVENFQFTDVVAQDIDEEHIEVLEALVPVMGLPIVFTSADATGCLGTRMPTFAVAPERTAGS